MMLLRTGYTSDMTITESINRGVNLLGVGIVGLAGFAFIPEVFFENDWPDKVDDGLLLVIGILGMWWYKKASNRFARSIAPVVLVALALITKIGAIIIEFDDAESVGDDFGALILFVAALGFVWYQYARAPLMAELASTSQAPEVH